VAPQLAESNTYAAAALYSAGTVATAVGDHHGAYEAYKASYETMPTPDALLASGDALYRLAQDTLSDDATPEG
jgi:hypothetical protein